ncbi:uncharacterized protein BT62DRAFT_913857, partial [Guyanagaster necrorhizus]
RLIESLIIHNILEKYGDDPETIRGFKSKEDNNLIDIVGEALLFFCLAFGFSSIYPSLLSLTS